MADGISGIDLVGAIVGKDPEFRPMDGPKWIPRPAPDARDLVEDEIKHQLSTVWDLIRGNLHETAPAELRFGRDPMRFWALGLSL